MGRGAHIKKIIPSLQFPISSSSKATSCHVLNTVWRVQSSHLDWKKPFSILKFLSEGNGSWDAETDEKIGLESLGRVMLLRNLCCCEGDKHGDRILKKSSLNFWVKSFNFRKMESGCIYRNWRNIKILYFFFLMIASLGMTVGKGTFGFWHSGPNGTPEF